MNEQDAVDKLKRLHSKNKYIDLELVWLMRRELSLCTLPHRRRGLAGAIQGMGENDTLQSVLFFYWKGVYQYWLRLIFLNMSVEESKQYTTKHLSGLCRVKRRYPKGCFDLEDFMGIKDLFWHLDDKDKQPIRRKA